MTSRVVGYALAVRTSTAAGKRRGPSTREILLEQRPAHGSVMPGMWELPTLRNAEFPASELRMTLRHAIMQVNYYVHIRTVFEDDVKAVTVAGGERRWVALREAAGLPLTGLTRKVLVRARLLAFPAADAIAERRSEAVV
jgi:A/G-specific adenine glycosylase